MRDGLLFVLKNSVISAALLWSAGTWAGPHDDARRHFQAGLVAADNQQLEVAINHFLLAQAAVPHPATVYNIARAYLELENYKDALFFYQTYQELADPNNATDVRPIIRLLEARVQTPVVPETEATPASPATTTPSPSTADTPLPPAANDAQQQRLHELAAELAAIAQGLATATPQPPTADGESAAPPAQPTTADPVPQSATLDAEAIQAAAQVADEGFTNEAYERVIITASRFGQSPLDSPSTTTIVTEEDIRMSGATTIAELLRNVTGVEVMSLAAGHSDVGIRGFNRELSNKVLVLIDGRSTTWDFVGSPLWSTFPISMEEIERIEVIRGPSSAIYGADAVTGVINIITRTPGEVEQTLIHTDVGFPGLARTTLITSGRTGGHGYRLSVGHDQHGSWSKEYDLSENASVENLFDTPDQARQVTHANGRIDSTFGEVGFASLSGGYAGGTTEFTNMGALGIYGLDFSSHYLRGDVAWGPVHLRAFWLAASGASGPSSEYKDSARTLYAPLDNDVLDIEVEAPSDWRTGEIQHRSNVGVGFRQKKIQFEYLAGGFDEMYVQHHFHAFLHEEASVGRSKLVGSLRVDRHPLIDDILKTLSPRGAFIYRIAEARSLRASAGTAFRAPTSSESYMDFLLPTSSDAAYIRDLGSLELDPERIVSAEIGLHDESSPYHTADVAVYVNQMTDLIVLSSVSTGISEYNPVHEGFLLGNTGWTNDELWYTGYGLEMEAEAYPITGLEVFANLNIMSIVEQQEGSEPIRDGSSSLVKANIGAMAHAPHDIDLTLIGNYASAQQWRLREFDENGQLEVNTEEVDPRVLLTTRVASRPLKNKQFEMAATIWNITAFAERHREHPKGQLVGPRAYGSINYEF